MSDLQAAIERARSGGPERHRAKSADQGKLPVRERLALLVDEGSVTEEAPEESEEDYPFEAELDEEERERRRRSVRDEQSTDDHLADFL